MKSKCCNKPLRLSRENPEPGETMYYICDGCNQPADPKCNHADFVICPDCPNYLKPAGDVAQAHLDTFNDEYELTDEQLRADDPVDKNHPDEREVSKLKEETMQNEPQLSAEMEKKVEKILDEYFPDEMDSSMYHPNLPPAVESIFNLLATALEEQKQEFINQKANQHDAMVRADEREKVLREVEEKIEIVTGALQIGVTKKRTKQELLSDIYYMINQLK